MGNTAQNHQESRPGSGFIGESARSVAAYCLLPDPRPHDLLSRAGDWFSSWVRPQNHQSTNACIRHEIAGKASLYHVPVPEKNSPVYQHIMEHAQAFARAGVQQCQVRDFHDRKDEPLSYVGYRASNGQCAVRTQR